MKLLLDLGNTRLKWCVFDGMTLGAVEALAHGGPDFLPAIEQRLRALPPGLEPHLVSVASPAIESGLTQQLRACFGHVHRHRSEARAPGLICAYPDPQRLGADRWLALRGALSLLAPPLLVVNAGTALTLDAVDASGKHLGGLILAGVEAQCAGLLQRAAHLTAGAAPPSAEEFWARDTVEAVAHAPWQAAAGLIERALRRLSNASSRPSPSLLLAGGDAEPLARLLPPPVRLEPNLVLRGLALAACESVPPGTGSAAEKPP